MGFVQTIQKKAEELYDSPRFTIAAFFLILVSVLIAYSNTFNASFHFDDTPAIVDNYSIKHMNFDSIVNTLKANRGVVMFSLMINYALGGLNVVGYHVFNILVHALNSMFVYLLILWTLSLPLLMGKYGSRSRRMALFGALLFAVHPVQTESVTYIITRTELLATFFYLSSFLLFIQGVRKKNFLYHVGAGVTAVLAANSKEWAVTLPAVLFVYDYLFLAEGSFKAVLSRWMSYVLVALSWGVVAYHLDLTSGGSNAAVGFSVVTTSGITKGTYLLTSFNVIWTYIRLLFLPINQNLDYDYAIAKTLFEFPTLLSFLGHVAVVGFAFWAYVKKGWTLAPFGIAWFYIGLSPVQSFVPIVDVIFEHRVYMPSIGFFIVFVAAYEGLFDWLEKRKGNKSGVKAQAA
jgi:hypothetical protein